MSISRQAISASVSRLPAMLTMEMPGSVLVNVTRGSKNPLWFALAKRLRRLRALTALSMRDIAPLAGCNQATVGNIENGKNTPSVAIVEGLAIALGVSPTYLAFGHDGLVPFRQKQPVPDVPLPEPLPNPGQGRERTAHLGLPVRLRQTRELRGHSLRGLAALAGLTAQAVLYLENSSTTAKLDTCELLAVALDVAPGWLAYGEGVGPAGLLENAEQQQQ